MGDSDGQTGTKGKGKQDAELAVYQGTASRQKLVTKFNTNGLYNGWNQCYYNTIGIKKHTHTQPLTRAAPTQRNARMITKNISTPTKTSQLYTFNTAVEADSFYNKYSTIWILSKPFQTLSGWTITRTINI